MKVSTLPSYMRQKYFLEADADGTDDDENENQADGGDEDAEKR